MEHYMHIHTGTVKTENEWLHDMSTNYEEFFIETEQAFTRLQVEDKVKRYFKDNIDAGYLIEVKESDCGDQWEEV